MFYYTSFYRHRDSNGKIIGYTLRNEQTGEFMQVTSEQLKDAICHKRVHIFNLKLTSDGRIIEAANPLNKPINNNHLNREHMNRARIKLVDDNEDLGYTKNLLRRDILESRVAADGPFTINKFIRIFTGRRQGRIIEYGNYSVSENDKDGDGFVTDDFGGSGGSGGEYN